MHSFHVPLFEHDWAQKWCIDVHNTSASRKLAWKSLLAVSTGNKQDISPFSKSPKRSMSEDKMVRFCQEFRRCNDLSHLNRRKETSRLDLFNYLHITQNIGMDKEHEGAIKDPDGSPYGGSPIISGEIDTTQESGENNDETKDDNEIVNHEDESVEEMGISALKKWRNEDEDGPDSEDKSDNENKDKDALDQMSD
eukprot:2673016-Ditylum_brightwellii.AAC.1